MVVTINHGRYSADWPAYCGVGGRGCPRLNVPWTTFSSPTLLESVKVIQEVKDPLDYFYRKTKGFSLLPPLPLPVSPMQLGSPVSMHLVVSCYSDTVEGIYLVFLTVLRQKPEATRISSLLISVYCLPLLLAQKRFRTNLFEFHLKLSRAESQSQ